MPVSEYEREGIGAQPDPDVLLAFEIALRLHADRERIRPRLVPVSAPAAGAEWSTIVPGGCTWWPLAIRGTFVASAAAANRAATVTYSDGNTVWAQTGAFTLTVAAATMIFNWLRGHQNQTNNNVQPQASALPSGVPLPQNTVVASLTANIQAADQWSAISLYVLEVRERQYEERADAFAAIMRGTHADSFPGLVLGL